MEPISLAQDNIAFDWYRMSVAIGNVMLYLYNPLQGSCTCDDQWQPVSNVNWEYQGTFTLTSDGGMDIITTVYIVILVWFRWIGKWGNPDMQ